MNEQEKIAAALQKALPDIPLVLRREGMHHAPGINVYRFTRTDQPSRSMPFNGTMLHVMYDHGPSDPFGENPNLHDEWVAQVREFVTEAYPVRYRKASHMDLAMFLIENPRTLWTRSRALDLARMEAGG
jgi:hypothetical protein